MGSENNNCRDGKQSKAHTPATVRWRHAAQAASARSKANQAQQRATKAITKKQRKQWQSQTLQDTNASQFKGDSQNRDVRQTETRFDNTESATVEEAKKTDPQRSTEAETHLRARANATSSEFSKTEKGTERSDYGCRTRMLRRKLAPCNAVL